jgi:flagellar motor switch protein FliM
LLLSVDLPAPGLAARALRDVIGVDVGLAPGVPEVCSAEALFGWLTDPLVAIVLKGPDARPGALLELEPRLARTLVDRALGGDGPVDPPARPLEEGELGILAYLAAQVLVAGQRSAPAHGAPNPEASTPGETTARSEDTSGLLANAGRPWQVATVLSTAAAARRVLADRSAVVWPWTVTVQAEKLGAWLWVPERVLDRPPTAWPRRPVPASLRLPLVAEAGRASLRARELAALRRGDVVVLDETWLDPTEGQGELRVRPAGSRGPHLWCALQPGGIRLARLERSPALSTTEGRIMDEKHDPGASSGPTHSPSSRAEPVAREGAPPTDALVEELGDTPVELGVELARFQLSLSELGLLRRGQVVSTGRPIGSRVTLRAGDTAIGYGELVDVDGEVGVRLLEVPAHRAPGQPSAPAQAAPEEPPTDIG